MKKPIIFLVSTFFLNLIWENAQSFLYQPHGDVSTAFLRCVFASLGDVLIVGILYLIISLVFRSFYWFLEMDVRKWLSLVIFSVIFAMGVEWWGIGAYRWVYADMMPMIPFTNIGLVPVLQMIVLNPIILFIIRTI
ncbi:hypothetical protein EPO17_02370 [Patescibacteria group bacterium]|nr:MAG: hypothetical protein EPO17_02370 [Patescibacteria group bacterium]